MNNVEIAEALGKVDIYEVACKTNKNISLTDTESEIVSQLDEHFKEVGRRGVDADCEIAAFIQKAVNTELQDAPDEILDRIMERGSIGENDDLENTADPKNTLVAYEAAKGGNVKRSYLDPAILTPTWKNRQIETEISYADLKRDGWKTVAKITEYAIAAFKNYMFKDIFDVMDAAIASGADNYLAVGQATMTQAAADAIALYCNEHAYGDSVMIGLTKYIQQISKLTGASDTMKDEVWKNGFLGRYDAVDLAPVSSTKKLGNDTAMFADKRVFGVCGKIGTLNQRGDVTVYEVQNPNKENVHLLFKNFNYGFAFNSTALEGVFKAVLS